MVKSMAGNMAPVTLRISGLRGKHGVFFMRKSTIRPNIVLTMTRWPSVPHLVAIIVALDIIIHCRRTSIQCKHMLIIMNITLHNRKYTVSLNHHADADRKAFHLNTFGRASSVVDTAPDGGGALRAGRRPGLTGRGSLLVFAIRLAVWGVSSYYYSGTWKGQHNTCH